MFADSTQQQRVVDVVEGSGDTLPTSAIIQIM
jgi:hypothetical protein